MTSIHRLTSADVRRALGHYPSGVAAMAARVEGVDHVLVASSFTVGVSLDPMLVSFAVQRSSATWPYLRSAPTIGVSVLSAGQGELCRRLASKDRAARWQGVATHLTSDGAILLDQAAVSFESRVHTVADAGDHELVMLEVTALAADHDLEPLLFHGSRFRDIQ